MSGKKTSPPYDFIKSNKARLIFWLVVKIFVAHFPAMIYAADINMVVENKINNNIWQMWAPGRRPVIWANTPWHEALDHPGAFQMGHVRRLFESRPFHRLQPNDDFIMDGAKHGGAKIRGALASDSSFAFIYSPRGEAFSVDLNAFAVPKIRESWYDPRYGKTYDSHTGDNRGVQTFVPPTKGRGQDWILILDDAKRNFPLPGTPD